MTAILATKLFEARAPRHHVSRPRLIERLTGARQARVSLVSAPAGYGKSTLLAEWCAVQRAGGERIAWVSIDDADNHSSRFWSHVAAALQQACGIGSELSGALGGSEPPAMRPLLERLVNELAALADPLLIVLDDLHAVTDANVLESLEFLVVHLPPHVHLVIATRVDPPFPIATWRARGELVEVRVPELRFTTAESSSYLGRHGLTLDDHALTVLEGRTEGWAAGLHLAALAMTGVADQHAFVRQFAGDHRSLVDYLGDEVLDRQPPDVVDFLLRTSVLERMCGELCDAVTGGCHAQGTLEALEASNMFVVPLDGTRTWFRYHHLFGELLRRELRRRHPDIERDLHRRASLWLSAAGDAASAVPHAVASGDWDLVIGLGTRHGLDFVVRGDTRALRELYGTADESLRARPEAPLGLAWLAMLSADLPGARRWLDAAKASIVTMPDVPPGPVLDAELLSAVLADRNGDLTGCASTADHVLDLLDRHPEVTGVERLARRARAELYQVRTALLRDEPERAAERIGHLTGDLLAGGSHDGPPRLVVEALGVRAVLAVCDGRADAGVDDARAALAVETEFALEDTPHGVWARLALGIHHLERLELEDAEQHITSALGTARHHHEVHCVALLVASWADWLRLSGLRSEAIEAVRIAAMELQDVVEPAPLGVRWLARAETLARLSLDDVEGAAAAWEEVGIVDATSARIALAQGDVARAIRDAELRAGDDRAASRRERIDALIVAALAHAVAGDEATANARLTEALTIAAPVGWLAPMIDAGPALRPLLRSVRNHDRAVARLRSRVLDVLAGGALLTARADGLVERLTERELALLRKLPSPLSNQEIARLLFVSPNTIKTQLQSIYRKLGVRSRHEAIERARELGLL